MFQIRGFSTVPNAENQSFIEFGIAIYTDVY